MLLLLHLVRICENLLAPNNGIIVGVCTRVYLSVCRMSCNEGYEATGIVERRCVENRGYMMWTGTPWLCEGKTGEGRGAGTIALVNTNKSETECTFPNFLQNRKKAIAKKKLKFADYEMASSYTS